jgi:ketosteroid isomerase-like protein
MTRTEAQHRDRYSNTNASAKENRMPPDNAPAERFAIRELIDRYCYAVNERDWAALASCWAGDGVWDVGKPLDFKLEGRQAIVQIASSKISEEDYVVQTPHATVIWLDGDAAARAHSTMMEVVRHRGGAGGIQILATYADDLVKVNGEWLFKVRRYRVTNIEFKAPAGDCYREWQARSSAGASDTENRTL